MCNYEQEWQHPQAQLNSLKSLKNQNPTPIPAIFTPSLSNSWLQNRKERPKRSNGDMGNKAKCDVVRESVISI